jgi:diguanylate cyclase (GGDEF)-like protein
MNAVVWVQALTLVALVAALGWALMAVPLRIFSRASRDFIGFNAWVLLAALSWWSWPMWGAVPEVYRLIPGLVAMAAGVQWLSGGVHQLQDAQPAYVLSPFMWPLLAVVLGGMAWLGAPGQTLVLTSFAACIWVLGVSLQQVFPSLKAQTDMRVARWALLPFALAALTWLGGLGQALWEVMVDTGWLSAVADVHPTQSPVAALNAHMLVTWLLALSLLNAGLVGLLFLKFIDKLRELSTEDEVTGALNMRSFMAMLHDERERMRRTPHVQSLLLCELDQLAGLNKQLGFAAGDMALRHVTAVIGRCLRKTDRLGRTAQGEFVLFLPGTPAVGGTLVADRVQTAIKSSPLLWNGQAIGLTFSMGVSSREDAEMQDDIWLDLARWGVERARLEGGSRVRVAHMGRNQDISITTAGELPTS